MYHQTNLLVIKLFFHCKSFKKIKNLNEVLQGLYKNIIVFHN